MKKYIVSLIGVWSCLMTTYAGTLGSSPVSFAGFWVGAGGSYVSTRLNGNTTIQTQPAISAPGTYILSTGSETHFAPVANVGYFHTVIDKWLLGPRVIYKYIGNEQFDISWSGTLQNGAYQTGGVHSKLQDEWLFLADLGYSFDNWLVYGGAGAALFNVSAQLNGDVLPSGSFNFFPVNTQKSKSLWGGAGHVGFEYILPHRFTVDFSYNFAISPTQALPALLFPSGNSNYFSKFMQSLQAVEQGVNVTINKYFDY